MKDATMSIPKETDPRKSGRGNDIGGGLWPIPGVALNHPALLLDVLEYKPWEFVSVCCKTNGHFGTAVLKLADVPRHVATLPANVDVYFGVNPVAGPARVGSKGKAEEVTRLAALWADLDVKPGACPDMQVARAIIKDLSKVLGTRPSATTHSGNGLQPYWTIIDGCADTDTLKAVLARWSRLVKEIAENHGAAADSVFNLDRVLRVPGTYNCKAATNGDGGIPVHCFADDGDPLTLPEIIERLDAAGIPEADGDSDTYAQLTDADVDAFLATYTDDDQPTALDPILQSFDHPTERHPTMFKALCWAMREAKAGRFPAKRAVDELRKLWDEATRGEHRGSDFDRMLRDAIARADAKSVDELGARVHGFSDVGAYRNACDGIDPWAPIIEEPAPAARSTRTGERCKRPAMLGGNVCYHHGGNAPQVKAKALKRLQQAADALVQRLLGMALDGDAPDHVALTAIRDALDRAGIPAKAEVSIELKPWERLMGDIAGIATISRDEHRARQGLPPDDPPSARTALAFSADAEVIDAELVEPDAETGPENRPSSPVDAMRGPDRADDPESDMPPGSGPPRTGLMTLQDAAEANRRAKVSQARRRRS